MVKARTWIGRASSVRGGLRMQRRCLLPTLCFSAVVWFVLSACGCEGVEGEVGRGGGRGSVFSAVSLLGVLGIPPLLLLNCRRFLAEQFFMSGDVCCWVFVSRVPRASMGLRSKIVCSSDGNVA